MLDETLTGTGKIIAVTKDRELTFILVTNPTTQRNYLVIDDYPYDIRNINVRPNLDMDVFEKGEAVQEYSSRLGEKPFTSKENKLIGIRVDPKLVSCGVIRYSKEMAKVYDLPIEHAFNYGIEVERKRHITFMKRMSERK